MRARCVWTAELDDRLRRLRSERRTWEAIAGELGLGRNTVLERGRKIGARRLPPLPAATPDEPADRPARPAGHPVCWALLVGGTVLDGERYPYPVFL